MPLYEYVCQICGASIESLRREGVLCPECKLPPKRKFSFNTQPVMQSHWNMSVGAEVSDPKKFKSLLSQRSDEQSKRLNMTVNFQPVDLADKKALGVTDDGMESTYAERRRRGLDAPKRTYLV